MNSETVVIAIVAALIGSTGLAGFITAGVQWTRSARLRRAVENNSKLIAAVGAETAGGKALAAANQTDSLRLAAMSLIRIPAIVWPVVVMLVVLVIALISYSFALGELPHERQPTLALGRWILIPASIGYIIGAVMILDYAVRMRRERFVRAMIRTGKVTKNTIREHDFASNRRENPRAAKIRRATKHKESEKS